MEHCPEAKEEPARCSQLNIYLWWTSLLLFWLKRAAKEAISCYTSDFILRKPFTPRVNITQESAFTGVQGLRPSLRHVGAVFHEMKELRDESRSKSQEMFFWPWISIRLVLVAGTGSFLRLHTMDSRAWFSTGKWALRLRSKVWWSQKSRLRCSQEVRVILAHFA